jgi:hypothetical protein
MPLHLIQLALSLTYMKILNAILSPVIAYAAIIGALITGKMMLSDDSDLPPHLRRENDYD